MRTSQDHTDHIVLLYSGCKRKAVNRVSFHAAFRLGGQLAGAQIEERQGCGSVMHDITVVTSIFSVLLCRGTESTMHMCINPLTWRADWATPSSLGDLPSSARWCTRVMGLKDLTTCSCDWISALDATSVLLPRTKKTVRNSLKIERYSSFRWSESSTADSISTRVLGLTFGLCSEGQYLLCFASNTDVWDQYAAEIQGRIKLGEPATSICLLICLFVCLFVFFLVVYICKISF